MELQERIYDTVKGLNVENASLSFLIHISKSSIVPPKAYPAFIVDENKFPFQQMGQDKSLVFQNQSCDLYIIEEIEGTIAEITEEEITRVKGELKTHSELILSELLTASRTWAGMRPVEYTDGEIEFIMIGETPCAVMLCEVKSKVKKVL